MGCDEGRHQRRSNNWTKCSFGWDEWWSDCLWWWNISFAEFYVVPSEIKWERVVPFAAQNHRHHHKVILTIITTSVNNLNTFRMKKKQYKGSPVTRNEFLTVLTSVKKILLRSTFHTDQIEALLEETSLSIGEIVDAYGFGSVEKCSCSSGKLPSRQSQN